MAYEPTEWARGTKITAQKLNNIERGVESVNSEYTPTTWAEGDIVTATKLNNIEQGIANASGGGGGDSDFSTAEVTVGDIVHNLILPGIITEEQGAPHDGATTLSMRNDVFTIILYKGHCLTQYQYTDNLTGEGNISISNGIIDIYGDCTISENYN